jgi:hypothetical protein
MIFRLVGDYAGSVLESATAAPKPSRPHTLSRIKPFDGQKNAEHRRLAWRNSIEFHYFLGTTSGDKAISVFAFRPRTLLRALKRRLEDKLRRRKRSRCPP